MAEKGEEIFQQQDILRLKNESGTKDVHYSIFHEGLPDEYKLFAERELGETAANKEKGLRKLREFMKKENLSCTDDLLLVVLRACKYNIKKSESKLKRFLAFRRDVIEKLCKMDEEKIEMIVKDDILTVLPYRDKQGRAVVISTPYMRFEHYGMEDLDPISIALVLYLLTFPLSTVCGMSYIGNCISNNIFTYYAILNSFRTFYVKHMFDLPVRYGTAHIMNEMFIVRIFCKGLRLILPEKLSKRIFLHGSSYESLRTFYHPDILTKDMKGNVEIRNHILNERLLKFIHKLREEGPKSDI